MFSLKDQLLFYGTISIYDMAYPSCSFQYSFFMFQCLSNADGIFFFLSSCVFCVLCASCIRMGSSFPLFGIFSYSSLITFSITLQWNSSQFGLTPTLGHGKAGHSPHLSLEGSGPSYPDWPIHSPSRYTSWDLRWNTSTKTFVRHVKFLSFRYTLSTIIAQTCNSFISIFLKKLHFFS